MPQKGVIINPPSSPGTIRKDGKKGDIYCFNGTKKKWKGTKGKPVTFEVWNRKATTDCLLWAKSTKLE